MGRRIILGLATIVQILVLGWFLIMVVKSNAHYLWGYVMLGWFTVLSGLEIYLIIKKRKCWVYIPVVYLISVAIIIYVAIATVQY